jgi:hypothetical protein
MRWGGLYVCASVFDPVWMGGGTIIGGCVASMVFTVVDKLANSPSAASPDELVRSWWATGPDDNDMALAGLLSVVAYRILGGRFAAVAPRWMGVPRRVPVSCLIIGARCPVICSCPARMR